MQVDPKDTSKIDNVADFVNGQMGLSDCYYSQQEGRLSLEGRPLLRLSIDCAIYVYRLPYGHGGRGVRVRN